MQNFKLIKKKEIDGMPVNLVHVILAPLSTSVKPVSIHLIS